MQRKELVVLTPEEHDAIMRAAGTRGLSTLRNRAMLALMWATGLRVGEVIALDTEDLVYMGDGLYRIDVPHAPGLTKRGARTAFVVLGEPDAYTPAGMELARWMQKRPNRGNVLFCTKRGTRTEPYSFRRALARYTEKAGIEKKVTPHMYRHTFATMEQRAGVPLADLAQALGHANPNVTAKIYLHSDEPRQAELARERAERGTR